VEAAIHNQVRSLSHITEYYFSMNFLNSKEPCLKY